MGISLLIHSVIVFGITFVIPEKPEKKDIAPTMKVMLITSPTEAEPEAAQALAQSNSIGEDEETRNQLLHLQGSGLPTKERQQEDMLHRAEPADTLPTRSQIIPNDSVEVAKISRDALIREIEQTREQMLTRPREKFVHANTKASELAPYLEKWRMFVERVGNMHYPEAARKENLEGELILDVAVHSDGTVGDISVLRSSGHWILDDSAEHIVRIASPFEPFPDSLRRNYDILHIVRTWKFSQNTLKDVTR